DADAVREALARGMAYGRLITTTQEERLSKEPVRLSDLAPATEAFVLNDQSFTSGPEIEQRTMLEVQSRIERIGQGSTMVFAANSQSALDTMMTKLDQEHRNLL